MKAFTFRIEFNGFESDTQISEEFLHLNAKGTIAFAEEKKFNQSINHRIKQISVVIITNNKSTEKKNEGMREKDLPENDDGIGRHDLLCLW